jgi:hypothetical protein
MPSTFSSGKIEAAKSLILLILATLGYIFTETSWGKNLASKAPLLPNVCRSFYKFVHEPH